jgi:hypothetical protein
VHISPGFIHIFIRSLKHQLGERSDYEDEIKFYQSNSPGIDWTQNMIVIPVHFSKDHKRMLAHAKKIVEYNQGTIAIDSRFDEYLHKYKLRLMNLLTVVLSIYN